MMVPEISADDRPHGHFMCNSYASLSSHSYHLATHTRPQQGEGPATRLDNGSKKDAETGPADLKRSSQRRFRRSRFCCIWSDQTSRGHYPRPMCSSCSPEAGPSRLSRSSDVAKPSSEHADGHETASDELNGLDDHVRQRKGGSANDVTGRDQSGVEDDDQHEGEEEQRRGRDGVWAGRSGLRKGEYLFFVAALLPPHLFLLLAHIFYLVLGAFARHIGRRIRFLSIHQTPAPRSAIEAGATPGHTTCYAFIRHPLDSSSAWTAYTHLS